MKISLKTKKNKQNKQLQMKNSLATENYPKNVYETIWGQEKSHFLKQKNKQTKNRLRN